MTSVSPSGNRLPAGTPVRLTIGSPVMSLAIAQPRTASGTTAPEASAVSTVTLGGAMIVGGVVSTTLTSWVAVPELPAASVAVQVTVVVPSGNTLPAGASFVTVTTPRSSLAVAVPSCASPTTAPDGDVASTVASGGAVIDGGVVSGGGVTSSPASTANGESVLTIPQTIGALTVVVTGVQAPLSKWNSAGAPKKVIPVVSMHTITGGVY